MEAGERTWFAGERNHTVELGRPRFSKMYIQYMPEFVYHCFPRRLTDETAETARIRGQKILKSMLRSGLLLTVEEVNWPELNRVGVVGGSTRAPQRRLSLTQLSEAQLPEHCARFGEFALEFPIANIVHLGGVPVIYFPRAVAGQTGLESVGANMVGRLAEIRNLLILLLQIEHEAGSDSTDARSVLMRQLFAELKRARGNSTWFDLIGGVDGLFSLFYPTDDPAYNTALHYYRQREWRLLNMQKDGRLLTRPPTETEETELKAIGPRFFSRRMHFASGEDEIVRHCLFYPEFGGRHILSYASLLLVPTSCVDEASSTISAAGISLPVAALPFISGTAAS